MVLAADQLLGGLTLFLQTQEGAGEIEPMDCISILGTALSRHALIGANT
jgi:hypothetical protein